jgi:hypothetical protein
MQHNEEWFIIGFGISGAILILYCLVRRRCTDHSKTSSRNITGSGFHQQHFAPQNRGNSDININVIGHDQRVIPVQQQQRQTLTVSVISQQQFANLPICQDLPPSYDDAVMGRKVAFS